MGYWLRHMPAQVFPAERLLRHFLPSGMAFALFLLLLFQDYYLIQYISATKVNELYLQRKKMAVFVGIYVLEKLNPPGERGVLVIQTYWI